MGCLFKIIARLLLLVNFCVAGIMVLAAYSSHLHPQEYPLLSCLGLVFPMFLIANLCFLLFWLIFKYRYGLPTLICLIVCLPQIRACFPVNIPSDPPEKSIKLLSYNVMSFNWGEKKDGKSPILKYLVDSKADIICLQEFYASGKKNELSEKEILTALKGYPYKSIRYRHWGTTRLACFSKFPILSAAPINYKSSYNESMLYTLKVGGDTLTLINNHFESNKLTKEDKEVYEGMIKDPNASILKAGSKQLIKKLSEASAIRSSQVDSVAKVIDESRHPMIIACGDFNDSPVSYTHYKLTERLDDAFTHSGNGPGISYNQNKFYFRIDNILVSHNLKAYQCTVDRSIKDSDHYPIWCYISKR